MVRLDLLVYFTVSCSLVSGQSLYYGLKGLKINLKPHITSRLPDEILWKHNNNKVIEFYERQDHVYGQFKNRVTLDHVSAELNISDLRYEDSGEYAVETYANKVFDRKTYKLEVIDKVAKPTISCQRDDDSFSTTHGNQATLSCSAESRQPQHLQYEWISHGTIQPGQKLTITLSDDNEEYSCRVSNPLTSETTKYTTKDCNSDESSSRAWIAVLISAVILLIVVIVAVIIWCMRKQKGSNKRRTQTEESNHFLHPPDKDSHPKPEYLTELVAHLEKKHASQFKKNCGTQPPVKDTLKGLDKPSSAKGLNNVLGSNKDDADADQHKEPDSSASEKTPGPEPVPAGLDNKADSDTKTTSPPLGRKPSYSEDLNNVLGSNKVDSDQHQEPDSSASKKTPEPESVPADPEKTADEDGEAKSPTANGVSHLLPESCSQDEAHLEEDNHHIDKSVSVDVNESDDDQKETNKGTNLSSDSDHPPSPTEADHSKTDTYEDSPDAAHSESEQEKDQSDSDEYEVQSNSSSAKTDNREDEGETDENQDQSSSKEKQADSDSEDEEQEKIGQADE